MNFTSFRSLNVFEIAPRLAVKCCHFGRTLRLRCGLEDPLQGLGAGLAPGVDVTCHWLAGFCGKTGISNFVNTVEILEDDRLLEVLAVARAAGRELAQGLHPPRRTAALPCRAGATCFGSSVAHIQAVSPRFGRRIQNVYPNLSRRS